MELEAILRFVHVLGAMTLMGTGAGIAFFMLMAHRTGEPRLIAHTASIVVVADTIFTATAAILQPITGLWLAHEIGWPWTEGWILLSIMLYVVVGVCWLPVVWIQIRLRDIAKASAGQGKPLCSRYQKLFRIWFACGFPAFASMLVIIWLMLMRPEITLLS